MLHSLGVLFFFSYFFFFLTELLLCNNYYEAADFRDLALFLKLELESVHSKIYVILERNT